MKWVLTFSHCQIKIIFWDVTKEGLGSIILNACVKQGRNKYNKKNISWRALIFLLLFQYVTWNNSSPKSDYLLRSWCRPLKRAVIIFIESAAAAPWKFIAKFMRKTQRRRSSCLTQSCWERKRAFKRTLCLLVDIWIRGTLRYRLCNFLCSVFLKNMHFLLS